MYTLNTPVSKVMTPFPYVVESEESLSKAIEMMNDNKIHHLPVVKNGKPFSILSDRETKQVVALTPDEELEELRVSDACSLQAQFVEIDTSIGKALGLMLKGHIGSLVVISEERVAGIFTLVDAARILKEILPES